MPVPRRRPATAAALGVLLLAACTAADPQAAEEHRIAQTVADAVVSPRQPSADGLVRAVLATAAARDGRLQVLARRDVPAAPAADPGGVHAVLLLRVTVQDTGWAGSTTTRTGCFDAVFTAFAGQVGRRGCPAGARPLTADDVVDRSPVQQMPDGADRALAAALRRLPARPAQADVEAAVRARLRALPVAPHGARPLVPPDVSAEVRTGTDPGTGGVLVAVWALDGRRCLLGSRVGGQVRTGRLSAIQAAPGEGGCEPDRADPARPPAVGH